MIDPLALPKAELHIHIEGTLEPELIFTLAQRNGVRLKYPDVEALRAAYSFADLQAFLDLYYAGMDVLRTKQDYVDLVHGYLARAQRQGVRHAEIFFDPQAHTRRGIALETVMDGLAAGFADSADRFGMTTALIACFLRDLPAASAMETLESLLPYRDRIIGVGLDSAEAGNPPSKFSLVYERARAEGFIPVAHAGEEGPPEYIRQALDDLKVARVDHGVRCMEDPQLVERLRRTRMPLTVCPLSNVRLRVVSTLAEHPLKRMLEAGLLATCNSDDPAYFGGYCGDNYVQTAAALRLSDEQLLQLARNSFAASFIDDASRRRYYAEIDEYSANHR